MIVTLLRESLGDTLQSVKRVIPDPNVILIIGKGAIGELRNRGLSKCTSDLMCFVDDDIILNRDWYKKCIRVLQTRPGIIVVSGKAPMHYTLGCMICRTEELKNAGGFPKLDDGIQQKLGAKMLTIENAVCEHQIKRGFGPIKHNLHFLFHGFQTEKRAGGCYNPAKHTLMAYSFLRAGYPDFAVGSSIWLIKPLFVFPFILEDFKDRKNNKSAANHVIQK